MRVRISTYLERKRRDHAILLLSYKFREKTLATTWALIFHIFSRETFQIKIKMLTHCFLNITRTGLGPWYPLCWSQVSILLHAKVMPIFLLPCKSLMPSTFKLVFIYRKCVSSLKTPKKCKTLKAENDLSFHVRSVKGSFFPENNAEFEEGRNAEPQNANFRSDLSTGSRPKAKMFKWPEIKEDGWKYRSVIQDKIPRRSQELWKLAITLQGSDLGLPQEASGD